MGLLKQTCGPFYAWIHQACPAKISAPHAEASTICPTKLESPGLWPTYPVCPASRCTPPATPQDTTRAQGIVDTLLYNARAVDPTLLLPLNTLAL
jgi:hypothetical protein